MKKLLVIAGTIVFLLLALVLIVPLALKGKIGDIVKREANARLTARLDFETLGIGLLRHFPNASLNLEGLTIVGEGPFEGDTLLSARRITVVVDLLSLFGDEGFDVKKIRLEGPSLSARKTAAGTLNWDVLKSGDSTDPGGDDRPAESASAASSSFRLSLRDVRIDDGSLRYADDSTSVFFSTSPLTLRLSGDLSARKSGLKLLLAAGDMRLRTKGATLLGGVDAELKADVEADLEKMRFELTDNTLRLNAAALSLDGWVAMQGDAVAMDMRLRSSRIEFRELLSLVPAFYTSDFKELRASGELEFTAWVKGQMRGSSMPSFEVSLGLRDGSFRYASLPEEVNGIHLAAKVASPGGVLDRTTLEVSDFGLTMGGNTLTASLYAATPLSDLRFRASASGSVDLGAIHRVYPLADSVHLSGLVSADLKAEGLMSDVEKERFERIKASGTFTIEGMEARWGELPAMTIRRVTATVSPASLTLGECDVTLGASDLSANGRLTGYLGYLLRGEKLGGQLYLRSELLDLNQLLGLASPSDTVSATPSVSEASQGIQAVRVPENVDLFVKASVEKILYQQIVLTDFSGELSARGGTLAMEGLRMRAFGGGLTASGSYSTIVSVKAPILKMALDFRNASFSQTFDQLGMVRKIVPLFEKTGGNYSLSMKLSTLMTPAMEADLPTMNASGELRSSDIRLQNLEIFDKLAAAIGNDNLRHAQVKDVAIRFTIADGRLSTRPFELRLGSVNLRLSGSTGLDQTIDYTARVALPEHAAGVPDHVDVTIGGTFASPKITVDFEQALRQSVSNLVDGQIQRLTGSENLSQEVARQAENLRAEARKVGERLVAAAREQREKLVAKAKNPIARIAAEKAGDALVKEAEKQADNLLSEAERQIEKLAPKQ